MPVFPCNFYSDSSVLRKIIFCKAHDRTVPFLRVLLLRYLPGSSGCRFRSGRSGAEILLLFYTLPYFSLSFCRHYDFVRNLCCFQLSVSSLCFCFSTHSQRDQYKSTGNEKDTSQNNVPGSHPGKEVAAYRGSHRGSKIG